MGDRFILSRTDTTSSPRPSLVMMLLTAKIKNSRPPVLAIWGMNFLTKSSQEENFFTMFLPSRSRMMQIIRVGSQTSRLTLSIAPSQASERPARALFRGPMVRSTGMTAPRKRVIQMPCLRNTSEMGSCSPTRVGWMWFLRTT